MIFKIKNGLCPKYLCNTIENRCKEGMMQTRNKDNLHINKCKTREEQKMLLHDGFKLYNSLPSDVKKEQNLYSFKKKIVSYLRTKDK